MPYYLARTQNRWTSRTIKCNECRVQSVECPGRNHIYNPKRGAGATYVNMERAAGKPGPPNQPSTFWAPCGKRTTAGKKRSMFQALRRKNKHGKAPVSLLKVDGFYVKTLGMKNKTINPFNKGVFIWLFVILLILFLFNIYHKPRKQYENVAFSDFAESVAADRVSSVVMQGKNITGVMKDGRDFKTFTPDDPELVKLLRQHKVTIQAKPDDDSGIWQSIFVSWFPMLLLIGVWIFFMRQMQAGGGKALAFGKSRARMANGKENKVTFQDVAGIEEAKVELGEIIEFLRDAKRFTRLGGRIPKGVLLVGQPGTGKTLLARAIAGEADVPFFSISGSDFVEMFVGVGASRVRDLFNQGKKNAPCIIFIDEIDAVGRHR